MKSESALQVADVEGIAPGSVVTVRDEQWLVTATDQTTDGLLVTAIGLSELVRDVTATFYEALDDIRVFDPRQARLRGDDTSRFRLSRVWLEASLRQIPTPLDDDTLTVSTRMLLDPLPYQQQAVRRALDPDNLRPRVLLADAVGLGKTAEIGMILAELVARGRGDRILIVTPRHVLEQTQQEMWVRFSLPFVRLDSVGIQRVRQQLPASRNPFAVFRRVIISIDTLKSDRYLAALQQQHWDAVVIDEAHNLANSGTMNNRLARTLARHTDALILASATPHNGDAHSFAELIRLLDPSAVPPSGVLDPADAQAQADMRRLVVRRHRYSPGVVDEVGAEWSPRADPVNLTVAASPTEDAVARELQDVWLFPEGPTPSSGANGALFGWTLAKAFLSSPAALDETVRNRRRELNRASASGDMTDGAGAAAVNRELAALDDLDRLNAEALQGDSAKLDRLVEYVQSIGVGPRSDTRVVVFAERIATLRWLAERLPERLGMKADAFAVMHGSLSDDEQQEVVDRFKRSRTDLRVLITGDVASEGVNLHAQCHDLVHFDIPWSLIRIEQRNGRIDRYGQRRPPRIATLLLEPSCERFSGDLRVLTTLVRKENEAHTALGDTASMLGQYSVRGEEDLVRDALMREDELRTGTASRVVEALAGGDLDTARKAAAQTDDIVEAMLFGDAIDAAAASQPDPAPVHADNGLFTDPADYLRSALAVAYERPEQPPQKDGNGGGVGLDTQEHGDLVIIPPADLMQRLRVLPQSYLQQRAVSDRLQLATDRNWADRLYQDARTSATLWPQGVYLGPLHPVLDWAGDRVLARLGRNEIPVVSADVPFATVAVVGTLNNRLGQVVSRILATVGFPDVSRPESALVQPAASVADLLDQVGLGAPDTLRNPGALSDERCRRLQPLVPASVDEVAGYLQTQLPELRRRADDRVRLWQQRVLAWQMARHTVTQRSGVREHAELVDDEKRLADAMQPQTTAMVRPLIVVVPNEEN